MWRAVWWALVVVAVAVTASVGTSWSMADVSLSCSKIGESGSFYQCDDRAVHVLGVWPLIGVGLLLAAPLVVAALAMRKWVSWVAVAAFLGLSFAGLQLWAASSYWSLLFLAVPLAALGSVAATFQRSAPRPGTSGRRSTPVA
ncbi:ABC transporter permease [Rhodococcus sp. BGS-1C]|uniref:ABC transporter permease n=1 Tax=unclassified Rhodococcus (in: high G+C Gram-positive bacteria) TaxID=192944 RepID=UPI0019D2161B|nr:ABC transporter permease [Rhodococcus sp. KRD197]